MLSFWYISSTFAAHIYSSQEGVQDQTSTLHGGSSITYLWSKHFIFVEQALHGGKTIIRLPNYQYTDWKISVTNTDNLTLIFTINK